MATVAKKKAGANGQATNGHANGNGHAPANGNGKVDVRELLEKLEQKFDDRFNPWRNETYQKQIDLVEKLRGELADAEAQLATMAKAAEQLDAFLDSPGLQRLLEAKPFDEGLKAATAKLRFKIQSTKYNAQKRRYETKDSGAKPWAELVRLGATDAQIKRNLDSLDTGYCSSRKAGAYYVGSTGNLLRFRPRGQDLEVLKAAQLPAELRRVMGIAVIAAPAKKKPAAQKSKPAKKSSKGKAVGSRPSAVGQKKPINAGGNAGSPARQAKPSKKKKAAPSLATGDRVATAGEKARAKTQAVKKSPAKATRVNKEIGAAKRNSSDSVADYPRCSSMGLLETFTVFDTPKGHTEFRVSLDRLLLKLPEDSREAFDAGGFGSDENGLFPGPVEQYLAMHQLPDSATHGMAHLEGHGSLGPGLRPTLQEHGGALYPRCQLLGVLKTVTIDDAPALRIDPEELFEALPNGTHVAFSSTEDGDEHGLYPSAIEGKLAAAGANVKKSITSLHPAAPLSGNCAERQLAAIDQVGTMAGKLLTTLVAAGPGPHAKKTITERAGYQRGGKISKAFKELEAEGYATVTASYVEAGGQFFQLQEA